MKTKKQINSKYLGMVFVTSTGEKWEVVRASKTSFNNYRFNLSRETHDGAIKTISILSKTMKKLATSYLTMEQLLQHKQDLRVKKINEYRNTAWYTFANNGSLK